MRYLVQTRMSSKRLRALAGWIVASSALYTLLRPAEGSEITWGAPFTMASPTDVLLPVGGTVHFAADFNTAAGFDPEPDDDDVINGIPFTQVGTTGIAGLLTHTFTGGPNFGAATFAGGTGDLDLDNLLNSHSWHGGDPGTATVTLQGLTLGSSYQIQVIGAVDLRECCAARTYEPDDGQGNFDTGTTLQRGLVQSIVGTFAADGTSQSFQWRSLNNQSGNNDPGMSGLVVTLLPGAPTGVVAATLNRDTGNLSINNGTTAPFDVLSYSVQSNFGSLSQATWNKVSNLYDKPSAPTPGNGSIDSNDAWTVLSDPESHSDLSEAELNVSGPRDGGAVGPGQTLNLGNVWIKSPTEDVVLEVLRSDGETHTVGLTFTGNGDQPFIMADLNFDNVLTPADWEIYTMHGLGDLSDLSPAERYQRGDLNNDGMNNLNDMKLFLDAYDAANGAGSSAALMSGSVPEPSTAVLLFLGGLGLAGLRRPIRPMARSLAVILAVGLGVVWVGIAPPQAEGAEIAWNAPSQVLSATDVLAPPGSTVHFAADFNSEAGFGAGPVIINGIEFTRVDAAGIPGQLTHTFASGPNFGAAAFPPTGNAGLDNLMNSHSWMGGNPATASVTLEGLAVGTPYQIQIFVADTRTCCAARTYEPDDGQGNFTTGVSINRGLLGSMVGIFTADATTQQFQWRSLNDATGNNDPAVSGLVVTALEGVFALDLEVNLTSGQVTIKNGTAEAIDIRGYEITSEAGALTTAGWTVPSGWTKTDGSSAFGLLAGALDEASNVSLAAETGSLSLGTAYNTTFGELEDDLAFRVLKADGGISTGTVSFVMGGAVSGDYNGNGIVDAADYTVWRDNSGSSTSLPNDDTAGVGPDDFTRWLNNFGNAGSGAVAGQASAIPEPSAVVLLLVACAGLFWHRVRVAASFDRAASSAFVAFAAALTCLALSDSAQADAWVDRTYSLGDDSAEGAADNAPVGSGNGFGTTFDSANEPGSGDLQDLTPSGGPSYINVTTTSTDLLQVRPGAAPGSRGIRFDGTDDFLVGARLNYPATSDASTGSIVQPPGPLDYVGISDRGFQLWVYPDMDGAGALQDVIADTNQHGVRISAGNTWAMRYNNATVDSAVSVDFNEWSHVMVVRPFGTATPTGGSILYVNGVAIAAAPGNYSFTPTIQSVEPKLVIAADTGSDGTLFPPGGANHFTGVLDDMTMFLMGTTTSSVDRGTFNLGEDNAFVAAALTGVPGDVNRNGVLNQDDINALVAGWRNEKRVNNVRVGDLTTFENGDLNFDGITNLDDVFIMHDALIGAGHASGFDFSLLSGVPEPSTLALGATTLVLWGTRWRGRTRPS